MGGGRERKEEEKLIKRSDDTRCTLIKVDLPPPVSFWKFTNVWPYKTYGGKPHTICMGETESCRQFAICNFNLN